MVIASSMGKCSACGKDAELGDGLCLECYDIQCSARSSLREQSTYKGIVMDLKQSKGKSAIRMRRMRTAARLRKRALSANPLNYCPTCGYKYGLGQGLCSYCLPDKEFAKADKCSRKDGL